MPAGTASMDMRADSLRRPHVVQTITAETARLTAGSIHVHPVSKIAPPARRYFEATAAPTLRHQGAIGWLRRNEPLEGCRPWARLARSVSISRNQFFKFTALTPLAR